MASHQHIIG